MTRLSYALRKYPAARLIGLALIFGVGLLLLLIPARKTARKAVISAISPNVGTPGDTLIIRGEHFGKVRGSSYVEFCGNRLTESSYIAWTNEEIRISIPVNATDGLVYVVNSGGKSNPEFFANELAIPVSMPQNPMQTVPTISDITPEKAFVGQVLVISGENFGSTRENSAVYFSCRPQNISEENLTDVNSLDSNNSKKSEKNEYTPLASKHEGFILPSEDDFDYEYWSETEIRVRVPDGAQTGAVFVVTENGQSTMQPITIRRRAGEKFFNTRHTYLMQVEASVSDIRGKKNAAITLHMPHPAAYSQQGQISITESKPTPTLFNYKNTSIFQVNAEDNVKKNFIAKQIFVVECSSAGTFIDRDYVQPFSEKNRMLYRTYTRADEVIPADTEPLLKLLPDIIFNVKNPYRKAELIFNYMVLNYKLSDKARSQTADPLDLVKKKKGDAYDFAVIFTALLRTAEVPARMLSGVLVNADKRTQNHWWTEFYIENFGWVPADVALGAGMEFDAFQNERHSGKYYFGNIDAQHVAFSLKHNVVKQSSLNNKVVFVPRSYASQSVWEESSNEIESYSSYWTTPLVIGIY